MAITNVRRLRGASAVLRHDYADEVVKETYRIEMNSADRAFGTLLAQAQSTTSGWANPLPLRGARYHASTYPVFVDTYEMQTNEVREDHIDVEVTYTSLRPGEEQRQDRPANPLQWPAEYNISWIEEEYVIEEAYNVDALGPAATRRQPSFGPVVNGALQEFDEPLVDTRRYPVLHITWNVPVLGSVIALNETFQGTTNKDTFLGAQPRRCKYLVAETAGRQVANDIAYYPMTVTVAVLKSTERLVNNVGWNYRTAGGKLAAAKVIDEESGELVRPSEPIFLKLDGTKAAEGTAPVVRYRYLREVNYNQLLPPV